MPLSAAYTSIADVVGQREGESTGVDDLASGGSETSGALSSYQQTQQEKDEKEEEEGFDTDLDPRPDLNLGDGETTPRSIPDRFAGVKSDQGDAATGNNYSPEELRAGSAEYARMLEKIGAAMGDSPMTYLNWDQYNYFYDHELVIPERLDLPYRRIVFNGQKYYYRTPNWGNGFYYSLQKVTPMLADDQLVYDLLDSQSYQFIQQVGPELLISLAPGGTSATGLADGNTGKAVAYGLLDVALSLTIVGKIGQGVYAIGKAARLASAGGRLARGATSLSKTGLAIQKWARRFGNNQKLMLGLMLTEGGLGTLAGIEAYTAFENDEVTAASIKAVDALFAAWGVKIKGKDFLSARRKAAALANLKTPNKFETDIDEGVFWSGIVRGGDKRAMAWVLEHGGVIFEFMLKKQYIRLPKWDPSDPATIAAWKQASVDFAAGEKGHIRVLQGDLLCVNAIFRDEFKALIANPNVKSITAIDPETGIKILLWSR